MSGIVNSFIKKAYLFSSEEDYLLNLMEEYHNSYKEEVDDENLLKAAENAQDHKGENMIWYSKAIFDNGPVLKPGSTLSIKTKNNNEIIEGEVLSINDKGVYFKFGNSIGFSSVKNNCLSYEVVNIDKMDKKSQKLDTNFYFIKYYFSNVALKYKETINSDFPVVKKRAQKVLSVLDEIFPTERWSAEIINSQGEVMETILEDDVNE